MKTILPSTLVTLGLVVAVIAAATANAQTPSAENDYRRARETSRAREAAKERALVNKLRTSIIPRFARMEGLTPAKIDQPKSSSFTSTFFSHLSTTDGRACQVQVNTMSHSFNFEDLSDIKSFFRPTRAKVLAALCGKARTRNFAQHTSEVIGILLNYAQTHGTDHEDYYKLERLTIAGANLGLSVYQSECALERWTISASCLSRRGEDHHDRQLLKSPKGILSDR